MQNRKGLVHIYCGDGKGKTSAAVGLAVRAAGRGMKVLMVRFLKTEDSGEVEVLRSIPCITLRLHLWLCVPHDGRTETGGRPLLSESV